MFTCLKDGVFGLLENETLTTMGWVGFNNCSKITDFKFKFPSSNTFFYQVIY